MYLEVSETGDDAAATGVCGKEPTCGIHRKHVNFIVDLAVLFSWAKLELVVIE